MLNPTARAQARALQVFKINAGLDKSRQLHPGDRDSEIALPFIAEIDEPPILRPANGGDLTLDDHQALLGLDDSKRIRRRYCSRKARLKLRVSGATR